MKTMIQLSFILLMVSTVYSEHEYCYLQSCPNRTHTLCQFDYEHFGERCQSQNTIGGFTSDEITDILKYHRFLRIPIVSKPEEVEWDNELASIAQRWANQCEITEDQCRNVRRFDVQQQFHVQESRFGILALFTSVKRWHDKESMDTLNFLSLSLGRGSVRNTAGQKSWVNANRIGCGKVVTQGIIFRLYLACNYGYEDSDQMDLDQSNY